MKKIDSYNELNDNSVLSKMKPIYGTNVVLSCGTIEYGNKTYLLDYSDRDRIINFGKSFTFTNENEIYPSFVANYKRFTYLDFIFGFNYNTNVVCEFKNGNKYDLRRHNVTLYHGYHTNVLEYCEKTGCELLEYIEGHYTINGHDAGIMKNPLWRILENGNENLLMYCEKDTLCRLCPISYQKILDYEEIIQKHITWHKHQNGYIQARIPVDNKVLYIHQIITGCYGNGKGTNNISVDHIDQNPLNNTWDNLRIATRKEQEENSKGIKDGTKRERKTSAKPLPDGIEQHMLKKYVVYYHEWLNKEHTKYREYFKVEKHPKLDKIWITTKSEKVSIHDKLKQANKVVDDLENDIYPEKTEPILPKHFSLTNSRGKPQLVFEKRTDEGRLNLKMVLPDEYDLDEILETFKSKVKDKYPSVEY